MLRPRVPIAVPPGRKLRVVIYARYSSAEQQASSITDQFGFCQKFLDALEIEYELTLLSDEEMSGELRDRPGINEVRKGIDSKRWDLLLSEDSSRLFRNESACFELVETAADEKVRTICPNDFFDTAEPDWPTRLHDAQRHHCEDNRYLRLRLERTVEGLWKAGAAVAPIRTGYRRRASVPATATEPEKGPFFDEIEPKWIRVTNEVYERVANLEPLWSVVQYADQQKLPKCRDTYSPWTEADIIRLIRRTIYRGVETFRVTVQEKKRRTGKKRTAKNAIEKQLTREMPHLRIVTDDLWFRANDAITGRRTKKEYPSDDAHPLTGIPRDSRGPLSTIFVCGVCGGKMYAGSRTKGGYYCSNVGKGKCWMKATADRFLTHGNISRAISERILSLTEHSDDVVALVGKYYAEDDRPKDELISVGKELVNRERRCQRLAAAIADGKEAPESLLKLLREEEHRVIRLRARAEELSKEIANVRKPPTREQILAAIQEASTQLLTFDRTTGILLRRLLDGPIRAFPYMQFGNNKVVLRAEFRLCLVKIAALDMDECLLENQQVVPAELLAPIDVQVDLFTMSAELSCAVRAAELAGHGLTCKQLSKELGISITTSCSAKNTGFAIKKAGMLDPYTRLTSRPQKASRWKIRPSGPPPD